MLEMMLIGKFPIIPKIVCGMAFDQLQNIFKVFFLPTTTQFSAKFRQSDKIPYKKASRPNSVQQRAPLRARWKLELTFTQLGGS